MLIFFPALPSAKAGALGKGLFAEFGNRPKNVFFFVFYIPLL